jgi:hypothetical protein
MKSNPAFQRCTVLPPTSYNKHRPSRQASRLAGVVTTSAAEGLLSSCAPRCDLRTSSTDEDLYHMLSVIAITGVTAMNGIHLAAAK